MTLGNAMVWNGDPNDPRDRNWHWEDGSPKLENNDHTYPDHEDQHVKQGEMLGPLYLPSNLLGGMVGLVRNRDWRGASNWNERGPAASPPRPWARRPE